MPRVATGESSLSRAVRVLEAFTAEEPALSVSEVARRSGLHVATASRIVGQLVEHGLLGRAPDRTVHVGMRMWELASRAAPTRSLRDAAMPFLEDLHAVVGHHAQLAVLDGDEVIFLERLSARDAVVNYSRIAGRLPLHISSSGMVLMAYGPPELVDRVLARPLESRTPATITTPDQLRAALEQVRRQGYALLTGHVHPDAAGIAVPVRNALGEVVAALSVIVPHDARAVSAVPALLAGARGIGRSLG
ncbi:IclR family transcriptional regulator [Geodermatophilus tzadiensis]|uniref:IclR family transcriptional regulator n=1 Tax=Geodermatophilus tzadiensis TaxID=1137988 RepID=A0A2T0TQN8_9ACTN|nr:IclR family transcriptional regulator [Geodermatophilus tzadiensis]PRY47986.1 IclR family transcriptional regulator [Geodermatophilus tzadiensis]